MSTPTKDPSPIAEGGGAPARPRRKPGDERFADSGKALNVFSHGFLALWAIMIILPLLWIILGSFKSDAQIGGSAWGWPTDWSFNVFVRAWDKGIGGYLLNTVIVLVFSVAFTMLFGVDGGVRAGPLRVPGQPAAVLPVRGRRDVPGVPRPGAAVLHAEEPRTCSTRTRG